MNSLSKVHHVDSKEHMLSETDILLVTAHDLRRLARKFYEKYNRPKDMTPERVLYNVLVALMQQQGIIRLREGNTMFGLLPVTEEDTYVVMANADTLDNLLDNLDTLGTAVREMGFKRMFATLEAGEVGHGKAVEVFKAAARRRKSKLQVTKDYIVVEFAE